MHGTVEWLPGQPLGNDRQSWSDELLGNLPNIYCYAANNPSESILAKRRGYGTLVSYNVPPYGRAGLYLELANLKDLVNEYRETSSGDIDLRNSIWSACQRCGIENDVPLYMTVNDVRTILNEPEIPDALTDYDFDEWLVELTEYLAELQDRLFSSGLHTLGSLPSDEELMSYLKAYFGDTISEHDCRKAIEDYKMSREENPFDLQDLWRKVQSFFINYLGLQLGVDHSSEATPSLEKKQLAEARNIVDLLSRNTEEMDR